MRKVILILGQTGSGKSFLTAKIRQKAKRLLTLDPKGEYSGQVFYDFVTLATFISDKNLWDKGNFNAVARFRSQIDERSFFRMANTMSNFLLCIDEAEIYLDPRKSDEHFMEMVRYGRHQNISILAVARRIPEISIDFRAMATNIISFKQIEPGDLKHLA